MKKIILFFLAIFIVSCSTTKEVQRQINQGNYDEAIAVSVRELVEDKHKEDNQPHILLLQEAFKKAVERDKEQILFLERESDPETYQRIFDLYNQLERRQQKIKPLLPLKLKGKTQPVDFQIENYQDKIILSKRKLIDYLYKSSEVKLIDRRTSKEDMRLVYDDLAYVNKLSPNFKNVKSLMKEAHFRGTDFVFITIKNETQKIIPKRLQRELLQFDTYGLNDFWTVYHGREDARISYDYRMDLCFKNIEISPERVKEKEYVKEKIIEEKTYVKDGLGFEKAVYKKKKVSCRLYEIRQIKTCDIIAKVNSFDERNHQLIESFPIRSGFVFEHAFATHKGDKRALEKTFLGMLQNREVRFPSNEQMVYDAGRDLKKKLKNIIVRSRKSFRSDAY